MDTIEALLWISGGVALSYFGSLTPRARRAGVEPKAPWGPRKLWGPLPDPAQQGCPAGSDRSGLTVAPAHRSSDPPIS
ncbi:MAG TPA: hypothetical protein VHU88_13780 [Sporichthyaceae bacterium]|nr:hypothetical protein [Sporichthyaceae bacterium]